MIHKHLSTLLRGKTPISLVVILLGFVLLKSCKITRARIELDGFNISITNGVSEFVLPWQSEE